MGAATTACSSEPVPTPFYGPAVLNVDASNSPDSGEPESGTAIDASAGNDSGEPVPVPFYGPAVVDDK
jgi:hypothetical protein